MGKRRCGFLTSWQWSYVKGQVDKESMSKSRQRVEDYYVMQSFKEAIEQFYDILPWLDEKGFSDSRIEILKHFLRPYRGRHKYRETDVKKRLETLKRYGFQKDIRCPECGKLFSFDAVWDPKTKEIVIFKFYGIDRKR